VRTANASADCSVQAALAIFAGLGAGSTGTTVHENGPHDRNARGLEDHAPSCTASPSTCPSSAACEIDQRRGREHDLRKRCELKGSTAGTTNVENGAVDVDPRPAGAATEIRGPASEGIAAESIYGFTSPSATATGRGVATSATSLTVCLPNASTGRDGSRTRSLPSSRAIDDAADLDRSYGNERDDLVASELRARDLPGSREEDANVRATGLSYND
jgi:hypothetical protein